MPAPSARSGLKEFVECPGVMSTVTCWANPGSASISGTMPVVKRFNRRATTLTTSDLRISCLMATELQRQEAKHSTLPRQVPCQKPGDSRPRLSHFRIAAIGKALGINVLTRKKEVSTTTEVHVLRHVYRDLVLVCRCAVFHKATV